MISEQGYRHVYHQPKIPVYGAMVPTDRSDSAIEGDVPKLLREKAEEVREDIVFAIAE